MELIDLIAGSLKTVRQKLDLDSKHDFSLASEVVELKAKAAELQRLLEDAEQSLSERDELIAQLRAAIASTDDMLIEGAAWFARKGEQIVDGPFCTGCFNRLRQTVPLLDVAKKPEEPGLESEWVQCPTCRVPFRSRLAGEQRGRRGSATRPPHANA
jgi:predicted  nucleic acid-binding Zn-ribbon protein